MKRILLLVLLNVSSYALNAQVLDSSGNSHVNFGVDGDTRNNFQKISTLSAAATAHHDDWFLNVGYQRYDVGGSGFGNSIFDTVGTATYKALLQSTNAATRNISFTKRMKYAAFDVVPMWKSPYGPYDPDPTKRGFDSSFWVDGVYFRDYANDSDPTSFSGGKNGDNPNSWTIGNSVSQKSDIVDVMTHVRTSGLNPVTDSVWFFAGVSTLATNGNRFFDIEVYRENFSYDESTKKFTSAGAISGHSAWTFNSSTGMVTRSGDIIISVSYQSSGAPEIDFRIFVAKSTYDSVVANKLNPATFKFATGQFQINTDGTGGYVQILAKSGQTNWGSGMANYRSTSTAAQDSTRATPWGTLNTSGEWSESYNRLQFIEIALNFSRFGMNPFHYVTSYCSSPYSSIIVKSRAATSFNANLEDFVVPQPFTVKNLAPFTVTTDTVTCTAPTANLKINVAARNYYRWFNANGDTLSKDSDTTTFKLTQPGTYYVEGTNFKGCPTMGTRQTIIVHADTTKPTAIPLLGHGQPFYFLNGDASSTNNSFGTNTYTYSWTGPTGFTATTDEDPRLGNTRAEVISGNYYLTTTNTRNGCTSAASMIYVDATTLPLTAITLQGRIIDGKVRLDWNPLDFTQPTTFEIERSTNGSNYIKVGTVAGTAGPRLYSFVDKEPSLGNVHYRIKSKVTNNNVVSYSNAILLQLTTVENTIIKRQLLTNSVNIQLKKAVQQEVQVKVMTLDGRLLMSNVYPAASQGSNLRIPTSFNMNLPASVANLPIVVALYEGSHLLEAKKL